MFCLFSVVGDGGASSYANVFDAAATGSLGTDANGGIFIAREDNGIRSWVGGVGEIMGRSSGYENGLHEVRLKTGAHKSLLNGAAELNNTTASTFNLQDFALGARVNSALVPAAIDVFAHGMFPDGVSDTDATTVRNYITALRPNILP